MHGNPALVTRLRAGVKPDPYQPRNPGGPDWDNPAALPLGVLDFAPENSRVSAEEDRHATLTGAAFYGEDPTLDVQAGDRLLADGTTWKVSGRPERWGRPGDGWPAGIVIPVEDVAEGARSL